MSKETKNYTLTFSRMELNWLYRQLQAGYDRALGIIKTYSGDAISQVKATEEQLNMLKEAEAHKDTLEKLTTMMKGRLESGEKDRLQLHNMRQDLVEAYELVGIDAEATAAIDKALSELPEEETYRISFDRTTLKFTLKLVDNDLLKYKTQIIPQYDKRDQSEFKDPIQTKTYWTNKARKAKDILDGLKSRLEKQLA